MLNFIKLKLSENRNLSTFLDVQNRLTMTTKRRNKKIIISGQETDLH